MLTTPAAEKIFPSPVHHDASTEKQKPHRKKRPLSWLTFNRTADYPRSISQRLRTLKDPSSSSLAKSTISAPVLTSTTNVKIARSEGVHCGELTPEIFDKSTWDSKIGWVPDEEEDSDAAAQARRIARDVAAEGQHAESDEKANRFTQAFKDRFRGDHAQRSRQSFSLLREDFSNGHDTKLAQYKAETLNFCKDKIRSIKDITQSQTRLHLENKPPITTVEQRCDQPLLHSKHAGSPQLPANNDTSSQFDSLTRSLNSILDKGLETEITGIDFLKRKMSNRRLSNGGKLLGDGLDSFWSSIDIDSPQPGGLPSTANGRAVRRNMSKQRTSSPESASPHQSSPVETHNPTDEGHAVTTKKDSLRSGDTLTARDRFNALGAHPHVMTFATAPKGVVLVDPRLPYPQQLDNSKEYAICKSTPPKVDFGTILDGSHHDIGGKEDTGRTGGSDAAGGIKKSSNRLFKQDRSRRV